MMTRSVSQKFISVFLSICLLAALCACGRKTTEESVYTGGVPADGSSEYQDGSSPDEPYDDSSVPLDPSDDIYSGGYGENQYSGTGGNQMNSDPVSSGSASSQKKPSVTTQQFPTGMAGKKPSSTAALGPLYEYEFDQYAAPIWEGDTVYHETVGFVKDKNGAVLSGSLLYKPDSIISVRSIDGKTVYKEGEDWVLSGRKLVLPSGSKIAAMDYDKYSPKLTAGNEWRQSVIDPTRCIIAERWVMRDFQVSVCYTHSDGWAGAVPASSLASLPKLAAKLSSAKPVTVLLLGDSITAGYEASGAFEKAVDKNTLGVDNVPSWGGASVPAWAEMICQGITKQYGSRVTKINRGSGSTETAWCIQNLGALLSNQPAPDLVLIAYGMNEATRDAASFKSNISSIMNGVSAHFGNAPEFLLVSCMAGNAEASSLSTQQFEAHEKALYSIASSQKGVAVAPVNTMFRSIMSLGKLYTDFSSNGLNHPNDFATRLYAQTILKTLS